MVFKTEQQKKKPKQNKTKQGKVRNKVKESQIFVKESTFTHAAVHT